MAEWCCDAAKHLRHCRYQRENCCRKVYLVNTLSRRWRLVGCWRGLVVSRMDAARPALASTAPKMAVIVAPRRVSIRGLLPARRWPATSCTAAAASSESGRPRPRLTADTLEGLAALLSKISSAQAAKSAGVSRSMAASWSRISCGRQRRKWARNNVTLDSVVMIGWVD
jgi:hypothetical protein